MKIFLLGSKTVYPLIRKVADVLTSAGNEVVFPNCFDCPEEESSHYGKPDYSEWKSARYAESRTKVAESDCVLVCNYPSKGNQGYIGGATLLEMYDAWQLGKPVYILFDPTDSPVKDEALGLATSVLQGSFSVFK